MTPEAKPKVSKRLPILIANTYHSPDRGWGVLGLHSRIFTPTTSTQSSNTGTESSVSGDVSGAEDAVNQADTKDIDEAGKNLDSGRHIRDDTPSL